jgi:transcription initiation factor TFIID subunit 5
MHSDGAACSLQETKDRLRKESVVRGIEHYVSTSTPETGVVNQLASEVKSVAEAASIVSHYKELRKWVDQSLDTYKNELDAVIYPVFVHCYLDMVTRGYIAEGKTERSWLSCRALRCVLPRILWAH